MTTIEIYERVPYDKSYHRYLCQWGDNIWYFTSNALYSHAFGTWTANQSRKGYTHIVDTIITNKNPKSFKDILGMLHIHMPELLI